MTRYKPDEEQVVRKDKKEEKKDDKNKNKVPPLKIETVWANKKKGNDND